MLHGMLGTAGGNAKTFVLGLGAQKWTTWLYQYLNDHPQCAPGKVKELAALRMLFGYEFSNVRWKKRIDAVSEALQNPRRLRIHPAENAQVQELLESFDYLASCADLDAYVRYYERQLAASPGAHVVADITPEYCMLTKKELLETEPDWRTPGLRSGRCS